jgi:hypothetical protein
MRNIVEDDLYVKLADRIMRHSTTSSFLISIQESIEAGKSVWVEQFRHLD